MNGLWWIHGGKWSGSGSTPGLPHDYRRVERFLRAVCHDSPFGYSRVASSFRRLHLSRRNSRVLVCGALPALVAASRLEAGELFPIQIHLGKIDIVHRRIFQIKFRCT